MIHAEEDDVASMRNPRYVMAHLGSRHKELVTLHNSYHMITVDNEREHVASETIRFLPVKTAVSV